MTCEQCKYWKYSFNRIGQCKKKNHLTDAIWRCSDFKREVDK